MAYTFLVVACSFLRVGQLGRRLVDRDERSLDEKALDLVESFGELGRSQDRRIDKAVHLQLRIHLAKYEELDLRVETPLEMKPEDQEQLGLEYRHRRVSCQYL